MPSLQRMREQLTCIHKVKADPISLETCVKVAQIESLLDDLLTYLEKRDGSMSQLR